VADGTLDPSDYDLLASESRLASSWPSPRATFRPNTGSSSADLSRRSVTVCPGVVVRVHVRVPHASSRDVAAAQSLLDLTCRLVVGRQIRYGAERRVPWGVSESAYNVRDAELNLSILRFRRPWPGTQAWAVRDVVVAPYATALAAMIDPRAALANFARLEQAGARGAYGFLRSARLHPLETAGGDPRVVVRAYMAHHRG